MELNRTNDRCDAGTHLAIEGEKPKYVGCRAQAYVKVETLRHVNVAFRNDSSGASAPGGLAISFP